jgi:hypothetical protein
MDLRSAAIHSRIGRVRLRARAAARDGIRLALESTLAGVDLEPPAFPPEALLLVRWLRVATSGATFSRGRGFEHALRGEVAAAARDAVRPSAGRVPSAASAVLFRDLTQALAVFALSVVERRTASEWWWPRLWPDAHRSDFVQIWLRHPSELPSVVATLADTGALETIAPTLSEAAGAALLAVTCERYHLAAFRAAALNASAVTDPGSRLLVTERAGNGQGSPPVAPADAAIQRDLGRASSAALDAGLPAPVRLWLAACAGLAAESRWVRHEQLASRAAHAVLAVRRDRPAAPNDTSLGRADALPALTPRRDGVSAGRSREPSSFGAPDETAFLAPERRDPQLDVPKVGVMPTPRVERALVDAPGAAHRVRREPAAPSQVAEPQSNDVAAPPPEVTRTGFGGVFYLANVALALELYDDFTGSGRPALALPFWTFLSRAAEWLLRGEDREAFRADPVFAWLAARDGDSAASTELDHTAVPVDWAAPEAWRAWAGPEVPPVTPVTLASWDDWLDSAMPWLERRIERALHGEPASILRQTAAIVRRPPRVSVHFALALHPIEVRLAGLDRDPGWIPAAGADLRFVYE